MQRWIASLLILVCANSAAAETDMSERLLSFCEARRLPCADEDVWCWKCGILGIARELGSVTKERDAYKGGWALADEAAAASEKLAEAATKEALRARPVVNGFAVWVPVTTLIGGIVLGVLLGGLAARR